MSSTADPHVAALVAAVRPGRSERNSSKPTITSVRATARTLTVVGASRYVTNSPFAKRSWKDGATPPGVTGRKVALGPWVVNTLGSQDADISRCAGRNTIVTAVAATSTARLSR